MARERRRRGGGADLAATDQPVTDDERDDESPEAGSERGGAEQSGRARQGEGPDDTRGAPPEPGTPTDDADAAMADAAVAEAIARIESQRRPASPRDRAVQHAARESMAAIEKFLGLAAAKGNPGREKVWVGRIVKHRVKVWQLVYDFDADYAYVARMDRGVYLTDKGKVLFTVGDSKTWRRRVAWRCDHRRLDTYFERFSGDHDVLKTPLLHHRRLLEGIARICAEQQLDWT
jgi:hypothetical protein